VSIPITGDYTVDDLIKTVSEKAGINPEQAKSAVNAVFDFVKAKMPMLGDQLKAMVAGGESGGNPLGDVMSKLGGLLGK
jgi:hypothetical protein